MHVCTKPVLASLVSALSASGGGGELLSLKYYMIFVTSSVYIVSHLSSSCLVDIQSISDGLLLFCSLSVRLSCYLVNIW